MKLGVVAKVQGGYAFKSQEFQNEGVPIIRIGNLDGKNVEIDNDVCYPITFWEKHPEFRVEKNDILIAMSGATVGKIGLYESEEKALLNQRVCILKPKEKAIDNEYLYFYCLSPSFKKSIQENAFGCAQPNISATQISDFEINVPTKDEQKHCVEQLQKLKSIINKRERELRELDNLIKSRFVEMFGSVHEDRFPKCTLRDVAHIKHGYAFSGEFFSEEENGVVLVTPGNFALGGGFQEVRNRYFTSEYPDEYVLHAGDLIVTMTDLSKKADTLGYGAIVPNTGKVYLHNQRIGLFDKLDERLNPVFIRWYMQTDEYRLEIVRTSTGSTVHHTSPDRILDSIIYIPPIELQSQFVQFAEQVDKLKFEVQKSLDETQTLMDSLMQQYFG